MPLAALQLFKGLFSHGLNTDETRIEFRKHNSSLFVLFAFGPHLINLVCITLQ